MLDAVEAIEIKEAFAAGCPGCVRQLSIDMDTSNMLSHTGQTYSFVSDTRRVSRKTLRDPN